MWPLLILTVIAVIALFLLRPKEKKVDLSVLPEQFVVIDVETTGLDPEKDEIIEIAAVKANRDSDVHPVFSALIKIDKPVPNKITKLTGITTEMLETEGEKLDSVITQLVDFIGNLRLVFYNAPFDHAFLTNAAYRFGVTIDNPVSCALDMARRAWPGLQSYKLVNLAARGGLKTEGSHRATKDCELTMIVYTAAATELGCIS